MLALSPGCCTSRATIATIAGIDMSKVERPEVVPMSDKLADELDARYESEIDDSQHIDVDSGELVQELVEPTDDEKKNGWTAETLTRYLIERRAGQSLDTDPNSLQRKMGRRPIEQDHKYNPLRWRG